MCCSALGSGVQHAMNNVAHFVSSLPVAGNVHRHVVVVTFILRRHQTNIQIEIQELEGGVRATGLLCLLGISVGLGSIFVYRLYTRLFCSINAASSAAAAAAARRKRRVSDLCSSTATKSPTSEQQLTPDSGIVADTAANKFDSTNTENGNTDVAISRTPGRIPRSYSDMACLHRRFSHCGSLDDVLGSDPVAESIQQQFRRTWAVENWLARADIGSMADSTSEIFPADPRDGIEMDGLGIDTSFVSRWSSADHGFASGWMTESAEFTSQDISRLTVSDQHLVPAAVTDHSLARNDLSDQSGLNHRVPDDDPMQLFNVNAAPPPEPPYVRRRLASDAYRWRRRRRFSVASSVLSSEYDYRESLVSKGFSVDLGEDLEGMMTPPMECGVDGRVEGMESLHVALQQIQRDIDDMNRKFDGLRSSAVIEQPPSTGVTFSCGGASDRDDDEEMDYGSGRQELDYMWDYRSDLVLESTGHRFVARRPIVHSGSTGYLRISAIPRNYSDLGSIVEVGGVHPSEDGMMQDMYIDDDEIVGVSTAYSEPVPSRLPPGERQEIGRKRPREAMSDESESSDHSSRSSGGCQAPRRRYGYVSSNSSACGGCPRHRADYSFSHSDSCCCGTPHAQTHCGFGMVNSCSGGHPARRLSVPSHACPSCHHCIPPHLSVTDPNYTSYCDPHHHDYQGHCCGVGFPAPAAPQFPYHPPPAVCQCTASVRPNCILGLDERLNRPSPVTMSLGNSQEHVSPSPSLSSCDHCNNPIVERRNSVTNNFCARGIGDKTDIVKAADTMHSESLAARKSCLEVLRMWNVSHVRSVSCDVYSVIRSVLYAALLDNLPILSRCGNLNDCCQRLISYADTRHKYLRCWNLHELMTSSESANVSVIDKLVECLRVLFEQVEIIGRLSGSQQRDQYLSAMLNGSRDVDRQLMEAVKVVMVLSLIAAYEQHDAVAQTGSVITSAASPETITTGPVITGLPVCGTTTTGPVVIWQLMRRDTSLTAEMFFHNHINCTRVGGSLCTQQLELSFLAFCLGLRLQVFQSSCVSESDSLRHFPDEGADHLPLVRIIRCDNNDELHRYYVPVAPVK